MGINVSCNLSYGSRIRNIATVAAALLGSEVKHEPINGSDGIFARAKGFKLTHASESEVTLAYIVLDCTNDSPAARAIRQSDGVKYHLLYHFEGEHGGPLVAPACTAAKIALCAGLVNFFGGTCDFNDCDNTAVNLKVSRRKDILASNDPMWSVFQQRMIDVKPITAEDIKQYEKYASY